MKNIKLNARQQALVNEYYEYGKTVVVTNFHFADGKELSTGYSLEDAYQEAAVALCTAAAHFNADRGVLFKTYAVTVIRNHLKKSAAYNRLQAARRDIYCSYVLC